MATGVLVAVAGAAFESAGAILAATIVAAVVGYYIDNEILAPDIDQDDKGNEIPQQQIGSEGGPATYCLGPEAVTLGQIIWMDDRNFVGNPPNQIAPGVAVAICRNPIIAVDRIFTRGLDLWIGTGEHRRVDALAMTSLEFNYNSDPWYYNQWVRVWMRSTKAVSNFHLHNMIWSRSNKVYIGGDYGSGKKEYTHRGNNWGNDPLFVPDTNGPPYKYGHCQEVFQDATYSYARIKRILGYAVCGIDGCVTVGFPTAAQPKYEAASTAKPVNLLQTFNKLNTNFLDAPLFVWQGKPGQAVDPWIQLHEKSVPNLPSFEGISYLVLRNLKVESFGRRVPEDMTMIVRERTEAPPVADAIDTILGDWHGWDDDPILRYDTSRLDVRTGRDVRGYTSRGNVAASKRLEPIRIQNDVVGEVTRFGVVSFRYYDQPDIFYVQSTSFLEPLVFTQIPAASMPTTVTVKFRDSSVFRYEEGSVDEHINFLGFPAKNETTLDLRNMSMTAIEARETARRHLWRPWLQRDKCKGKLPARWSWLHEGNAIQTEYNGDDIDIMITKIEIGANWEIEFEGYRFYNYVLEQAGPYLSN